MMNQETPKTEHHRSRIAPGGPPGPHSAPSGPDAECTPGLAG